jgi:hypothetical protein
MTFIVVHICRLVHFDIAFAPRPFLWAEYLWQNKRASCCHGTMQVISADNKNQQASTLYGHKTGRKVYFQCQAACLLVWGMRREILRLSRVCESEDLLKIKTRASFARKQVKTT